MQDRLTATAQRSNARLAISTIASSVNASRAANVPAVSAGTRNRVVTKATEPCREPHFKVSVDVPKIKQEFPQALQRELPQPTPNQVMTAPQGGTIVRSVIDLRSSPMEEDNAPAAPDTPLIATSYQEVHTNETVTSSETVNSAIDIAAQASIMVTAFELREAEAAKDTMPPQADKDGCVSRYGGPLQAMEPTTRSDYRASAKGPSPAEPAAISEPQVLGVVVAQTMAAPVSITSNGRNDTVAMDTAQPSAQIANPSSYHGNPPSVRPPLTLQTVLHSTAAPIYRFLHVPDTFGLVNFLDALATKHNLDDTQVERLSRLSVKMDDATLMIALDDPDRAWDWEAWMELFGKKGGLVQVEVQMG